MLCYPTHDQDKLAAGSQATHTGAKTLFESAPNKVRTLMECPKGSDSCWSVRRDSAPTCRIYVNWVNPAKDIRIELLNSLAKLA